MRHGVVYYNCKEQDTNHDESEVVSMGTKVYARQINPECQESPLFVFGFEGWENVSFCGNRNYRDRMSPLFERVNKYLANMAADWEDAN